MTAVDCSSESCIKPASKQVSYDFGGDKGVDMWLCPEHFTQFQQRDDAPARASRAGLIRRVRELTSL